MDKIMQNRHKKEGWEGIEDGVKSFLLIYPSSGCFFLIL